MNNNKFLGWRMVAVCFLLMALVFAPGSNLFGLFVLPLANEFSVGLVGVNMIMTISTLTSMVGALFAGKVLARFGIRRVVCILLAVFAASYAGMAFVTALPQLYLISALRGFCGLLIGIMPISVLVNNWFAKSMRGKAMGFAMMGSGIGAMVLNPVTGYVIQQWGWRRGYLFFGGLALLMIPLVFATFITEPQQRGMICIGEEAPQNSAAQPTQHGYTPGRAVRTGAFWLILLALACLSGLSQSWNSNAPPYLGDLGFSQVKVATILSVSSLGITLGKPLMGSICDRLGIKSGMLLSGFAFLAGYALLLFTAAAPPLSYVAAIIMGFSISIVSICAPLLVDELFGNRALGVLTGYMQVGISVGAGVLPILVALLFDVTGAYISSWVLSCGLSLVVIAASAIAFAVARKYAERQHSSC